MSTLITSNFMLNSMEHEKSSITRVLFSDDVAHWVSGGKKVKDSVKWNAKTIRDRRVLKKWEGKFDKKALASELQDLYIEAHKMLCAFVSKYAKIQAPRL